MSRSFTTITAVLLLAVVMSILAQGGYPSWAQTVQSGGDATQATPAATPETSQPEAVPPVEPTEPLRARARRTVEPKAPTSTGTATEKAAQMGGMMGAMAGEMMMGSGMEDAMMGGSGGMMGPSGGMMGGSGGMMGGSPGEAGPIHIRLRREASRLRQAKTVEAKEQSKKALEALLSDYFDNDMKRRQAELDQVKQRVARLEALFERRQAAKEEIIELQLKMTVNESEGLGFFSEPAPGSFGGYGGVGYGMDGGMGGDYGEMGEEYGHGMEMMGGYGGGHGGEMMGSGGYGMEMSEGGTTPE
jgi:hypothetical protein